MSSSRSTSKRLVALLMPHKWRIIFILLGLIAGNLFAAIPPWLNRLVIDNAIGKGQYDKLRIYLPVLLGSVIMRSLLDILIGYSREVLGQKILQGLKQRMYDHLQSLSMGYFNTAQTGQLMSRFTNDAEQTRVFLAFACIDLFSVIVTFCWTTFILAEMNWKLTLICMSFLPFLAREVIVFRMQIRKAWTEIWRQMAILNTRLQESITGIRVVKAFTREPYESIRFKRENRKNYINNMKATRISSRANPFMDFLGGMSWVILLGVGGYMAIKGSLTVGTLVAFNGYLWSLIWPIRHLGWIMNVFGQAQAASDRVFEVLDTKPEIKNPANPKTTDIKGYVKFDNVSFRYSEKPALKDISFEARPGQVIAIVGKTGSGKTTMINMISRLVDPQDGSVTIDGIDVKDMELSSLRKQVGVVFQETFLFSDSLRNNISYGNPSATDEELIQASKWAQAYDFISELEEGYETPVGERGVGLSGGQKQRVAIARAFLKNPGILILDDATASLDMRTEFRIFEALKEIMKERTTFIVAQRLVTVKDADLILVMDQGEIVERGTHIELLKNNGLYSSIFRQQQLDAAANKEVAVNG